MSCRIKPKFTYPDLPQAAANSRPVYIVEGKAKWGRNGNLSPVFGQIAYTHAANYGQNVSYT